VSFFHRGCIHIGDLSPPRLLVVDPTSSASLIDINQLLPVGAANAIWLDKSLPDYADPG
jgi:hypothetical protein